MFSVVSTSKETILVQVSTPTVVVHSKVVGPLVSENEDEDEMVYSKRIDTISDAELYKGEAPVGSSESSPVWRIRKITIVSDDITEVWASGVSTFIHAWSDRLSKTYI